MTERQSETGRDRETEKQTVGETGRDTERGRETKSQTQQSKVVQLKHGDFKSRERRIGLLVIQIN